MSQYQGLDSSVIEKLTEIKSSLKNELDLDDRAIEALKEFPESDALKILTQFETSNPTNVANKSAFLCGVMKTYRAKMKTTEGGVAPTTNSVSTVAGGPDDTKIQKLLDTTGFNLNITAGQRRYFDEGWTGPIPGNGTTKFCSQIFIGKLPRDAFEDELIPLLAEYGSIYEFRLMFDSSQARNKGYGFCHYTTKEAADKAVKALHGSTFKHHTLGVNISPAKTRLFVGSIPKAKTKEEIFKEFTENCTCEGVNDVIVYTDPEQPSDANRGFAFIDFDTHEQASQAKKKMANNTMQPFKHTNVPVDWAQVQEDPDDDEMAKVKNLYVSNLPASCTEEKLAELFGKDKNNQLRASFEKVKKIKNYAFVFFKERSQELQDAIDEMNGQVMEDSTIKVELAKPQSAESRDRKRKMMDQQNGFEQGGFPPRGRGGRGAMGGRGGPRGGGAMGGGYPPYGGGYQAGYYDQGGYGGFYGQGYDATYDATYAGGYQQAPRGAPRGGRGAPTRGGPARGGFAPRGAAPRGGPRGAPGAMAGAKRPAPFQQGAGGPPKKNAWEQAAPQQAYAAGQEYYADGGYGGYGQAHW